MTQPNVPNPNREPSPQGQDPAANPNIGPIPPVQPQRGHEGAADPAHRPGSYANEHQAYSAPGYQEPSPTLPMTQPEQRVAPRSQRQERKRGIGGMVAAGVGGAVLGGLLVLGGGAAIDHIKSSDKAVSAPAEDGENNKDKLVQEQGLAKFDSDQATRDRVYGTVAEREDPYNWGRTFNLTVENTEQAKANMVEVASHDAGIAAAILSEAGYIGDEGPEDDAPQKENFANLSQYEAAVKQYETYLKTNPAEADQALSWLKNDYLPNHNAVVEYHSGNYQTWGQMNGQVYLEDSAWGDSQVIKFYDKDGNLAGCFRADCGWQPYEEIAVQVTQAAPVQAAVQAVAPAPVQHEVVNVVHSEPLPPPPAEQPPAEVPPQAPPPQIEIPRIEIPNLPPITIPPIEIPQIPEIPTLPPPPTTVPKIEGEDFNANPQAIHPWGDSQMAAPTVPTPLADLPEVYVPPAAPVIDNGNSSPGGGGFSGPSIDSNLGGGLGGSVPAPGVNSGLNSGMTDL